MNSKVLAVEAEAVSPAGAAIRFLLANNHGNMIHSTLAAHQVTRATIHKTVSELWFVLEGQGELWRKQDAVESFTDLVPGTAIDIPVGTAFQYRNLAATPLHFICISMPPWPGDQEASYLTGPWQAYPADIS